MELRAYQNEDVLKMLSNDCIGNFSEQRTGKTPTTCASLAQRGLKHVLIICPASLCYVWKEAWKTWTGGDAYVMKSTKDKLDIDYETALIVNYEKFRGTAKSDAVCTQCVEWKPEAVVVDEAHRMKDRKSLTSVRLHRMLTVPVRIALTGTPATNKPWDVWSVLNWLFPKEYSSYWRFVNEYFDEEIIWVAGQPHRQPAKFKPGMDRILQKRLDMKCIQHKRAEVMKWLPKEEEPTRVILPATKQQLDIIDQLMTYFEYKDIVTKTVLDNLIRVRQVCATPEILGIKGKSPKLEWLQQYLKDYPEKQVLVFSNSKKFLKYIGQHIKQSHYVICGDVVPKARIEIVNKFQRGEVKVLLCQTQACKEGLTLDTADVSIFMDVYPPSADYLQAKDRMVATTKDRVKPKELIHVMLDGTYDVQTYSLVQKNVDETAIINDYKQHLEARRKQHGEQEPKRSA